MRILHFKARIFFQSHVLQQEWEKQIDILRLSRNVKPILAKTKTIKKSCSVASASSVETISLCENPDVTWVDIYLNRELAQDVHSVKCEFNWVSDNIQRNLAHFKRCNLIQGGNNFDKQLGGAMCPFLQKPKNLNCAKLALPVINSKANPHLYVSYNCFASTKT